MALRLRENKNINGIKVKIDDKAHIIKISQLADDTTLFVSSKTDIALAMNEIEIFGSFSGLILNRNKTEGIWIGKLKNCKDKIRGIKWTQNPVKALGIFFGHNKEECQKLNWEKRIEEMKNQFTAWGKRNLTIMGKILIIKTLILPKFTFLASSCVVPKMYIKEIESCFYRFIWNGKPDKIKRLTLIGDYEKGGLNMVDINSYFKSLKVSWVKRLLSSETSNWKVILKKYLDKFGKNWLIFKMNIDNQ